MDKDRFFIAGIILICIGLYFIFVARFRLPLISLGRLPGDIFIKRGNFTFYFPLASGVVISLLLTFIIGWLFKK